MMSEITDPDQNNKQCVDEERRRFLLGSTCVLASVGALSALTPLICSWLPSAKAHAEAAPVRVDLSKLQPGEQAVIAWRGKPVWIIRRTEKMLQQLGENSSRLRDPSSITTQQPAYAQNEHRSINPEYLVVIGICTHLGCSPKYKPTLGDLAPDWPGGFFCPCHGSSFDLSGRVFKNVPAPINLEVPPYYFIDKYTLVIGEHRE